METDMKKLITKECIKIFIIVSLSALITFVIFDYTPKVFAANWFVDMNVGGGANNGTSTDDAWQSTKTAIEYGSFTSGDKVWVKRDSVWDEGVEGTDANISPTDSGDPNALIYVIGWPRASKSINCDWVNGSTTVDNVDSNDMDREQHVGRGITGPDGFRYIITYITDSNTFVIDREYAGSTSADEDVTIEEDVDYDEAQALDDSTWTIKLSTWTDDADDLPSIDFNDENYNLAFYQDNYWSIRNFHFLGSIDSSGILQISHCLILEFRNVLLEQTNDYEACNLASWGTDTYFNNCIIIGDSGAAGNMGIFMEGSRVYMSDSATYGFGSYGFQIRNGSLFLDNVNIGVEVANADADIVFYRCNTPVKGHDVKLGGTNGLISFSGTPLQQSVSFTNYGKVLGAHRAFYYDMYADRVDVTTVTPNKKSTDYVLELDYLNSTYVTDASLAQAVYHYQVPQSVSKTYRLYIYNDTGQTLNTGGNVAEVCLRCRYLAGYDDTSEYVYTDWTYSDEANIADAADADDWDYVEVGPFTPVNDNANVECELLSSRDGTLDTGNIYVDLMMQHP